MIAWLDFGWLILGFVGVTVGADIFVGGAAGIARRFGISPLLVGLTIVALGTSAPEIAVNVTAAVRGRTEMAIGNVLGSNILNVLGVLGLCAVLRSIVVNSQLVRLDVPVMIGAAIMLGIVSMDFHVGPIEAGVLVLMLVGYTAIQIRLAVQDRRANVASGPAEQSPEASEAEQSPDGSEAGPERPIWVRLVQLAGGSTLLVIGSDRLVLGATMVARWWGLNELVIGLTVVAVGTSLPEIATSVAATMRGQGELAVGNVVGSNIYNMLAVVGLSGLLAQEGLPVSEAALFFDMPVMVVTCIACLPIFLSEHRIDRWEGALFIGFYLAYISYVLLATKHHSLTQPFGAVMLYFVVPLTAITLAVTLFRSLRRPAAS